MGIREEFEKLEEIANLISESDAYFADEFIYFCDNDFACGYLNGAWYAFQEQQKKIDGILSLVCKLQYSSGDRIFKEVQELLK